jgi:hypothetical protein
MEIKYTCDRCGVTVCGTNLLEIKEDLKIKQENEELKIKQKTDLINHLSKKKYLKRLLKIIIKI